MCKVNYYNDKKKYKNTILYRKCVLILTIRCYHNLFNFRSVDSIGYFFQSKNKKNTQISKVCLA